MNPSRQAPLQHPLRGLFARAVEDITGALSPGTARQYRGIVRNFLFYLGDKYPEVHSLEQLRRDPHILGWLAHLRSHQPPLAVSTVLIRFLVLRGFLVPCDWGADVGRNRLRLGANYDLPIPLVPRGPRSRLEARGDHAAEHRQALSVDQRILV